MEVESVNLTIEYSRKLFPNPIQPFMSFDQIMSVGTTITISRGKRKGYVPMIDYLNKEQTSIW
ncbi:hypothetical protein ACSTS3_07530 [Aquimarina muelleri]|uniref:hypothetical protein n=1 Tax=Aquimarina muelleri TaxID=279356 RepID=UPI003F688E5C